MIAVVVVGLVALAVLAVVVGIVDSASTGTWRAIARERRATWEERQRERRLADIRAVTPPMDLRLAPRRR